MIVSSRKAAGWANEMSQLLGIFGCLVSSFFCGRAAEFKSYRVSLGALCWVSGLYLHRLVLSWEWSLLKKLLDFLCGTIKGAWSLILLRRCCKKKKRRVRCPKASRWQTSPVEKAVEKHCGCVRASEFNKHAICLSWENKSENLYFFAAGYKTILLEGSLLHRAQFIWEP